MEKRGQEGLLREIFQTMIQTQEVWKTDRELQGRSPILGRNDQVTVQLAMGHPEKSVMSS